MNNLFNITGLGLFFGMIGTTMGGIVGANLKFRTNILISFVLEFSAGLMTAVICFDLIPQSIVLENLSVILIGIFLGILGMIFFEKIIENKVGKNQFSNNILKTGIIIGIGLAIHNLPEGLAIGSGFEASSKLGISLAIAIAIHDFPEGISIAIPMRQGGLEKGKTILLTALSGVTTGIGAFIGAVIGSISAFWIALSLAFASGTMLYIVSCELIPESNKIYKGRFASFGNIIGIIIGIMAEFI